MVSIIGGQLRQTIDRTQGSRKERTELHRRTTQGRTRCHLSSVRLQQRRQPKRHQLWQYKTYVKYEFKPNVVRTQLSNFHMLKANENLIFAGFPNNPT